jgi:uncharacterized protein (TIGR04255 family)
MSMTLPVLDERPLSRSPLAVVVFQVKFEQNLSISTGDTALRVHDQLGGPDGRYVRVEPVQVLTAALQVNPLGVTQIPTSSVPSRGFRMSTEDGSLITSLMPDYISIDSTAYGVWKDDFRERVSELLAAIAEHVKPRVEERLGIRYVNKVMEPEVSVPADFQGIISDGLLGPAADEFWSPGLTGLQQQLEMSINHDIKCVLRHGTLPRNTGIGLDGYLLDIDVFRDQPRRFDVDAIIGMCDQLNTAATGIFQRSLTASYLNRLREAE